MGRIQLFEFEDQPWFPQVIRAYMQDHLTFMAGRTPRPYQGFVMKLKSAMERLHQRELLDLCSGSGGPARVIVQLLRSQGLEANGRVSDLFPNLDAYRYLEKATEGAVRGVDDPVDATNVPMELRGFRLVANGFHHLPPQQAIKVLADAVAKQQGIAVVEMVNRSILAFLSVGIGTILTFLAAPFIKPFRFSRLFFTYLIPLIPLCLLWDGIVSCLRVYSPAELQDLVSRINTNDYEWDIGALRLGPGVVTYLIGIPATH
jgi:hypothetical protein